MVLIQRLNAQSEPIPDWSARAKSRWDFDSRPASLNWLPPPLPVAVPHSHRDQLPARRPSLAGSTPPAPWELPSPRQPGTGAEAPAASSSSLSASQYSAAASCAHFRRSCSLGDNSAPLMLSARRHLPGDPNGPLTIRADTLAPSASTSALHRWPLPSALTWCLLSRVQASSIARCRGPRSASRSPFRRRRLHTGSPGGSHPSLQPASRGISNGIRRQTCR